MTPTIPPPLPVLGMNDAAEYPNTSGTRGEVPPEAARGWNWGAFFFSWVWLFAHRMPVYAILTIVWLAGSSLVENAFELSTGFGNVIDLCLYIALAVNGNRLAWQNRPFESVEHFRKTERIWAYWALGLFLVAIAIMVTAVVFGIMGAS